jgi:antitoxin (DNA-binding transcriptional repressor) of toxin-antitoxin stability system
MPLTVKASEARANFPSIAKRVHENNIEVTVFKGSKPYVKIVPIDPPSTSGDDGSTYFDAYLGAADEYRDLFEALSK